MASQVIQLNNTPKNIKDDNSLSSGSKYLIQNVGNNSVKLWEGTSTPTSTNHAHLITPFNSLGSDESTWIVTIDSLEGLFAWGDSVIVVSEA